MVGAQTLEHPLLLFTVQQQGAESETEQPGLEPALYHGMLVLQL